MPVYELPPQLWFPPEEEFEDHGIVAVGGDLSPQRLILAYQRGIFPWYNPDEPITWFSPIDRMVLPPSQVKISKSSRNLLNRQKFEVKADTRFVEVINNCQKIRRSGQAGTWLNDDLKHSIITLHKLGYAHSVEAYEEGKLVGGLYGLSIGKYFFGDSMFSVVSNASKICFITLARVLEQQGFKLIDCQVYNKHLASLGAFEIPRSEFLQKLAENPVDKTLKGSWESIFQNFKP